MGNIRDQVHQKCPVCGITAVLKRRHCTFWTRLKTLHSTFRPYDCHICGTEMMVDVFYRDTKDIWLEVAVAIGGLLFLSSLAVFLVSEYSG